MRQQLSVALILSLAAVASAGQDQSQRSPSNTKSMRFAGMDQNRDGVITRQEWRGSAQSFQVHDWNRDGVLSGDEVRVGARRPSDPRDPDPFDSDQREYPFSDWTANGFRDLDHDRNGRVTRDEWHFDLEDFRRADHNRDGWISREEFLGGESSTDDDRNDRFEFLDANRDGRVSRAEWHGTADRFAALDDNRDGVLSRAELRGGTEPPPDLFTSVDVNRDNVITQDEWHWSLASFDARDRRLSRAEFGGAALDTRSNAYRQGYDRGLSEGRQAGKEDKQNKAGWDLEGQRELEQADSGYQANLGPRAEYQSGYRDGFRRGYREGFGPE